MNNKSMAKHLADSSSALPTSWTTIYTAPKSAKVLCTEFNFIHTAASTITIQVRLLKPDGSTSREWGQATLSADGEQVHFLDENDTILLESQWSIQIQETTGATVHYTLQGIELNQNLGN